MTKARRKAWIIVAILAVLGIGGGIFWHIRHNTSEMKYKRAQLALQANKFDKATSLATDYITERPNDWKGYYLRANIFSSQGSFAQAREALIEAQKLADPGQKDRLALAIAHTYSNAALQGITGARQSDTAGAIEALNAAVKGFAEANKFLESFKTDDPNSQTDFRQAEGMNHFRTAMAHQSLSFFQAEDAKVAEAARDTAKAAKKRGQSQYEAAQARKAFGMAIDGLLEVVQKDPSRDTPGETLLQCCMSNLDPNRLGHPDINAFALADKASKALADARKAIIGQTPPPPNASIILALMDLQAARGEGPEKITAIAKRLDKVIAAYPGNAQAKLARAKAALAVGNVDTTRQLADSVLKTHPNDIEARLLRIQTDLFKAEKSHGTEATDLFARAEKALYELNARIQADNPYFAQAHFLYAIAADKTGKKGLALNSLHAIAQLREGPRRSWQFDSPSQEYFVSVAERSYATRLLEQGAASQALMYAEPYYKQHPADVAGLRLFVESACQAGRKDLAEEALKKARSGDPADPSWTGHATTPQMLLAVVDGFSLVGKPAEAQAALNELIQRARQKAPTNPAAILATAEAMIRNRNLLEAEKLLTDAASAKSCDPHVLASLAKLYRDTGRLHQAEELYSKAVADNPREPSFRIGLAQILADAGDLQRAEQVLEPAIAQSVPAALLDLRIRGRKGEKIQKDARELLDRPDFDKRLASQAAAVYLAAGQPQDCLDTCTTALKDNPNDPDVLATLSAANLAMGDRNKAVETLKQAITNAPYRLGLYEGLAKLLLAKSAAANTGEQEPATSTMSVKELDDAIGQAGAVLKAVPSAREDLADLAMADICATAARTNSVASVAIMNRAAEYFGKVADNPTTSDAVRFQARLRQASCLTSIRKADEALGIMDKVIDATKGEGRIRAMGVKANMLAALGRPAEAVSVLDKLTPLAVAAANADALRNVALLYLRFRQPDKAVAACDKASETDPNDPRSYTTKAVVLTSCGRLKQVPDLYEKAIALQPYNFGLYDRLADAFDLLGQPDAALEAVRKTRQLGRAGTKHGLMKEGTLLARWGLDDQAVQRFQQLLAMDTEPRPACQLALAYSLRNLGSIDAAKTALTSIGQYCDQYVPARLMLADLAQGLDAKLEIIRTLEQVKPGNPSAIADEMNLLIAANRPADAIASLERYRTAVKPPRPIPAEATRPALIAAAQTGDSGIIARIGKEVSGTTTSPQMHVAAALLTMNDKSTPDDPNGSAMQNSVYPTMVNLCIASRVKDANTAARCADRLTKLNAAFDNLQPSRGIVPSQLVLCGIIADDDSLTRYAVSKLQSTTTKAAAAELLASKAPADQRHAEATELLKAEIAREIGLTGLSQLWSAKALAARPTCQWAAMEMGLAEPDAKQLQQAADTVRPADCPVALSLRADLLNSQGQHKQAAEMFADLAKQAGPEAPMFLERQARALGAAGQVNEALALYRKVWQATKSPISANNAACLVAALPQKNQAKLDEAAQWITEALKKQPLPAFADTAGWIAHLRGKNADALFLLRRAVVRMGNSPEVHYHLGVVENAAGNATLGQWHMAAAVQLVDRLKAEGKPIPKETAEIAELAKQAIAAKPKPQQVN